jgi:ABC-type transport system involved in cytochrome c biogenesis permease subunit
MVKFIIGMKNKSFEKKKFPLFANYYKYELFERLDYWSYRVITFGFIILTLGILCGAVWANEPLATNL